MKRNLLFAGIIFLALACENRETHTVQEQTINEAVYASGEVMPAEYYFLKSQGSNRLQTILVAEGDTVEKGDVLVVLGGESSNRQLELLTQQVELARQNAGENSAASKELRNRIDLARQNYQRDSAEAERYRELAQEQAVSQSAYEQAWLQAQNSLTQYKNLQQEYNSLQNELSSRLLNARHQLALLQESMEGKTITSPIKGKVYRVYFEEGELVQPTEPVIMVGLPDKYKLELLVDERDINRVKPGQKVYFETDAFAGEQFEARINKISPVLQRESRSLEAEAEVLSKNSFYPQASVEANILIREEVRAVVVPGEYILKGDSVLLLNGKNVHKVKVQTGTQTGGYTEIKTGLKEGDVLTKEQ